MSRLPDSFLPSGALQDPNENLSFAGFVTGRPSSVISPLALPRNANQELSYFEDRQSYGGQHPTAGPAQFQQQQQHQRRYLSPHRSPPTAPDQRSAALSPGRQGQHNLGRIGAGVLSPTLSPLNDSAEQMSLHLRRVLIQNRRLLENWEAERAHLEANRARAEEIYREERGIMDEDRMLWAEQEAQYISRIADLERENAALRGFASRIPSLNSRDSSTIGTSQTRPTVLFAMSLDSASNNITPNHGLGHTMPESHPFEPLDPRMQGVSPQTSTPGDGPAIQENTPSIDVQEVHPDLEGIPLKSTAVKKSTFTDGKPPSPPLSASNVTGSNSNLGSPNSRSSKATPAEVTIETLQAPEASRLVMHAGHTPNHSMSTFSTAIFTNASNTAGSSGTSTPIHSQRYPTRDAILAEVEASNTDGPHTMGIGLPEVTFKPSEHDPELKGPLSLRNQPAFDEIFLAKVGDKLQDSIQTDDATPTVLKHGGCELEGLQPHETATVDQVEGSKTEEHEDVPLKFKFNSNFGAPLGAMHGF